jgi:hypothetical protein
MKYHIRKNGSAGNGWLLSTAKVRYVPPAHKYCATGAVLISESGVSAWSALCLSDFTSNKELPVPDG